MSWTGNKTRNNRPNHIQASAASGSCFFIPENSIRSSWASVVNLSNLRRLTFLSNLWRNY